MSAAQFSFAIVGRPQARSLRPCNFRLKVKKISLISAIVRLKHTTLESCGFDEAGVLRKASNHLMKNPKGTLEIHTSLSCA